MRNEEANLQAAIVDWIRTVAPGFFVFHVPNGGLRSKSEAARMKWQGVTAGVPDLVMISSGGVAHFLEVKAKGGVLSDAQRRIMEALDLLQAPVCVVKSIDDVRAAFERWGISTREASVSAGEHGWRRGVDMNRPIRKVRVTVTMPEKQYDRLTAMAKTAGCLPSEMAATLFQAAYEARFKETGDVDLDNAVARVGLLFGSQFDLGSIASTVGISEAIAARIIDAWRNEMKGRK